MVGLASAACAETIDDAMGWALRSSITTQSDNARQDAAVARLHGSFDAFLPTVSWVQEKILSSKISYSPDFTVLDANGANTTPTHEPDAYGIQASLPLFDGFKRYNNLRAAEISVDAGRHLQLETRQQVLLEAASAYLAVIRDRRIVELRKKQLQDIKVIATRTETRLATHDTTLTDLYIAKSRVVAAQTAIEQSESDLRSSKIEYQRMTGVEPGALPEPHVPDAKIPLGIEEFKRCLVENNPKLIAAQLDARAAGYSAKSALSEVLPKVNLVASYMRQSNISDAVNNATDSTVKVQLRVPLYEPGALPGISETAAIARQKNWEAADYQRQGVASASALYFRRLSIMTQIKSAGDRIKSMQQAVDAIATEQSTGSKTVIDTLNARSELAEAQIAKVNMEFVRDSETFTLAASLGRLGPPAAVASGGTSLLQLAGFTR
jgi:outer membrane protein TolC